MLFEFRMQEFYWWMTQNQHETFVLRWWTLSECMCTSCNRFQYVGVGSSTMYSFLWPYSGHFQLQMQFACWRGSQSVSHRRQLWIMSIVVSIVKIIVEMQKL